MLSGYFGPKRSSCTQIVQALQTVGAKDAACACHLHLPCLCSCNSTLTALLVDGVAVDAAPSHDHSLMCIIGFNRWQSRRRYLSRSRGRSRRNFAAGAPLFLSISPLDNLSRNAFRFYQHTLVNAGPCCCLDCCPGVSSASCFRFYPYILYPCWARVLGMA